MTIVILLALTGAALGSFAALLAERLVRREPFALARSRCRSCGTDLRPADLIPLVSYPWLRGRCRQCGARIPPVLWQAEVTGALMGAAAGWAAADPGRALLLLGWMAALLALAVADLRWFRLPEPLLAVSAILGLAVALAGDGTGWPDPAARLTTALWGAALGGGAFWLIRWTYARWAGRQGMGMGDVWLMAALGLALGAPRLPLVVLLAATTALLLAVLRAWRKGRGLRRLGRLPFGAALALAACVVAAIPY